MSGSSEHRSRTLLLTTMLHAFTHIYQMALIPLYLQIQRFYGRATVDDATLLVTVLLVSYFLPSYGMGMMADRFSRKKLLSFGLALNALGFIALALAPSYGLALMCVIVAGFGGSFFHPAATALIARLYPQTTGRALGFLGIGASIGFCIGPLYAGWRAKMAHDWRAPVMELGIAGLVGAAVFAWFAVDHGTQPARTDHSGAKVKEPMFPTPAIWLMFLSAALFFFLRDFTGSSMGTVGSLFLQKARGFDVERTGFAVSFIFLASAISNPWFGHLSDRSRLKFAAGLMIVAAGLVAAFPHVPSPWVIPALLAYGFFFMASYPIVEAALMESVPDSVRGRVFGLFITIGGLLGNLSHWLAGKWVEGLGANGNKVSAYYSLYGWLAIFLIASLAGLPCLRAIRQREIPFLKSKSAAVPVPTHPS
jgi:MFS transporter, FSR family, fosmidomycin resistance protein